MDIKKIKVYNMTGRSGHEVPNQFIIETDDGQYFQSYRSIIAFRPYDRQQKTVLDENKLDCSAATGRYRNDFLGECIAETRRKIASGEYLLADLN
jgi:hypothetical protein